MDIPAPNAPSVAGTVLVNSDEHFVGVSDGQRIWTLEDIANLQARADREVYVRQEELDDPHITDEGTALYPLRRALDAAQDPAR